MKAIVFRAASDGSISVSNPSYTYLAELIAGGMTETEALTFIATNYPPNIEGDFTWRIIERADLPSDRYFRNAWEWEE